MSPPAMSPVVRRVWLWGPALAYMALIFWVSHQPKAGEALMEIAPDVWWHSVEYAVLGFLLFRSASPTWPRWSAPLCWLAVAVAGSLYGASDELHQHFVPSRHTSLYDWLADTVGAALGGLAGWGWHSLCHRHGAPDARLDTPSAPR